MTAAAVCVSAPTRPPRRSRCWSSCSGRAR
jgi:hypothetical protein